jgi:cytochrome b involved in lipid metabolism
MNDSITMRSSSASRSGDKRPRDINCRKCDRRPSSSAIIVLLSLLALSSTQLPLVQSFVQSRQRVAPLSFKLGGPLPLPLPNSLSPFSTTALGYDHDKSPDTNLRITTHHDNANDPQIKTKSNDTAPPSSKHGISSSQAAAIAAQIQSQHSNDNSDPATLVNIRYRGTWYDVTKWRRAHSAGSHWLDWFDKRDATEILDGLHSTHSRQMTIRLPKAKPEVAAELEANVAPDSQVQIAFRTLFDKLLEEGWWNRDMAFEARHLTIWASLFLGAVATAKAIPILSFSLLALSFVGGGWLGHDYIHGLDSFSKSMRNFLPLTTGLSGRWWSDKHNKHHALSKFTALVLVDFLWFVQCAHHVRTILSPCRVNSFTILAC